MTRRLCSLSLAVAALGGAAEATPLPDPVRAMIEAAAQRRDPAVLDAVASVARQTAPEHVEEIDEIVASYAEAEEAPSEAAADLTVLPIALADPPPPVIWKGAFEVGGSHATGATDVTGVYGALDLTRKSRRWSQRLTARADYQQTHGEPTTDRMAVAYQPQHQLGARLYTYGLGQYEHDRSLGIDSRYTMGAGLGVTASDSSQIKIALDAGPAIRRTEYSVLEDEESLAARASLNIRWLPTERVTVAQELATFAERGRLNTQATTALDTRLFGPLKARLSYNLQYERDEPRQRTELETTSRATLLYSF